MKKLYTFLFFLSCFYSAYSQQPEWIIFKTPPLPSIKISQNNFTSSIALSSNKNKRIESSDSISKFGQANWFGSNFSAPGTLPDNFVQSLALDEIGNIWMGTYFGGLAKYDGTNWTVYNTSNSGLPSNIIYSLVIDRSGNKWIGTTSGLAKYDGTNWKVYNTSNSGLPSNVIYSLAIDRTGNKWIGTTAGLSKFSGRTWKTYNTANSKLPHNYVTALTIDRKGNKWIGTFAGLAKFRGTNWRIYNTYNSGLPFNDIYSLSLDRDSKLIVETWGGGFAIFNEKKWNVFKTSNSHLPDNYVSSFVADGKGNSWIGTLSGLVKFDGKNWTVFNTSNSNLPDNMVYSLIKDNNGNLWIGTHNGLAVFNEVGINPIRIKPTAFYAEVNNNYVSLTSKIAAREYFSSLEVERKTSISDWEKTGIAAVHSINSSEIEYLFVDRHPVSGKVFYRLKQIDLNGKYKYSNIIDLFVGTPNVFLLEQNFPWRKNQTTKLRFGLPEKTEATLSVHNSYGEVIHTLLNEEIDEGYYEINFDTSNLITGDYFYRISTPKFTSVKKLILFR